MTKELLKDVLDAIEYLEPFSKEIPLISEYDTPEDIEWDKKRIMVNNLSYTALKFMKVMLEPSDDVLDKLNSYPSHLCHQRAPKTILRSRMKVLVTQSLKEVQAK